MSRFHARFCLYVLLVSFFATLSFADPVDQVGLIFGPTDTNGICTGSVSGASCAGYQFTATWDPDQNLLTFTVQKTALATQDAYFQGFSLSMFNPNGADVSASLTNGPAGFTVDANTKINNGGDTCQGTHAGTVCVQKTNVSSNGPLITMAGLTFQITITGWNANDLMSSWDLLATGTACASGSGPRCGNVFALTNVGPTGPPLEHEVPEPSSLVMFGSGLLGLGSLVRRFRG
jgi:hypothetical protein